jgi:hypothetical protein
MILLLNFLLTKSSTQKHQKCSIVIAIERERSVSTKQGALNQYELKTQDVAEHFNQCLPADAPRSLADRAGIPPTRFPQAGYS